MEPILGCTGYGNTNASGTFILEGIEDSNSYEGTWSQTWYVGGITVNPTLRFFVGSNVAPTIKGPQDTTSVAFWYLGGAPSVDGYYVKWSVYITTNSADPSPSISWSTDSPTRLSISGVSGGATLTSLSPSGFGAGYDIRITVTVNGVQSSSFPVFIDTPFTMTTSSPGEFCRFGACGCFALGYPPTSGVVGYADVVNHGIAGISGNTLAPIRVKESLEKQQWIHPAYAGSLKPMATPWKASDWVDNAFPDVFSLCGTGTLPNPPPTSYNPNGGIELFNETQKFWVGTETDFQGVCVQRGIVRLYTNHGPQTNYTTPIVNKGDCNPGTVIN